MLKLKYITLAILMAGLLLGCESKPKHPAVYVVDDAVKIGRDGTIFSHIELKDYTQQNSVWDNSVIRLAGAKGETIAFQLMLQAGAFDINNIAVEVSDLKNQKGVIPASSLQLFKQEYVKVTKKSITPALSTGKGEYPDPLIPFDALGDDINISIPKHKTQGIWIDLTIPRDVSAGTYKGTVFIKNSIVPEIPVEVTVYNFTLTTKRNIIWRVGYGGFGEYLNKHEEIGYSREVGRESAAFREREKQLYRLVWSHRLAPTTHYSSPIPEYFGRGAKFDIKWNTFKTRFGHYLDGSAFDDGEPLNTFSLPVNLVSHGGWPTTLISDRFFDSHTLRMAYLKSLRYWYAMGWPTEHIFVYLADEPKSKDYKMIKEACHYLTADGIRSNIALAVYKEFGDKAEKTINKFDDCVNIWEVAANYANVEALKKLQESDNYVGVYQGGEPFIGSEALDADGLSLITWPWIAWRYGLDQLYLYNATEWDYARLDKENTRWRNLPRDIWTNPLNQSWQTNSQGVLIYPGDKINYEGVVPSIRLKQARRGLQDYEYFLMADKDTADDVVHSIIPQALSEAAKGYGSKHEGLGPWSRDPRDWATARKTLAQSILNRK